MKIGQRV